MTEQRDDDRKNGKEKEDDYRVTGTMIEIMKKSNGTMREQEDDDRARGR